MRPRKPKILPEILPCRCGDIGVTIRPRGGRCLHPWTVACLSPDCDFVVRGFDSEEEAILAWNKEAKRK